MELGVGRPVLGVHPLQVVVLGNENGFGGACGTAVSFLRLYRTCTSGVCVLVSAWCGWSQVELG